MFFTLAKPRLRTTA